MRKFIFLIFLIVAFLSNIYGQPHEPDDEDAGMPREQIPVPLIPDIIGSGKLKSGTTGTWSCLGPYTAPTDGSQSLGLTKAVAIDMTDDPYYRTIYVGTAFGGVFKTTNGGTNWTNITDVLGKPGMGTNYIAIDPNNHNVIYIATDGSGVFKSVNGGGSWSTTGLNYTPDQQNVCFRILIDPANSQRIYVLVGSWASGRRNSYVYRSTDGGTTFSVIYTLVNDPILWNGMRSLRDIEMKPGDPNTLYISSDCMSLTGGGSVIMKTTNATDANPTWVSIASGYDFPNVPNIALAVSAKDPNCLFADFLEFKPYNAWRYNLVRFFNRFTEFISL
jgi:hypothetical protein